MPPRALPRKAIALFRLRHARGMLTSFSLLETYGLPRPRASRLFLVNTSPGAFKIVIFGGHNSVSPFGFREVAWGCEAPAAITAVCLLWM